MLGTGALLLASPTPQQMERQLERAGVPDAELEQSRALAQRQLDQLKAIATKGQQQQQQQGGAGQEQ